MSDLDSELETAGFDPRKRRLCPDGACLGVVGADARCNVCGARDEGAVGLDPSTFAGGCASDEDFEERTPAPAVELTGDFDPNRKLCPDGACVGVIGDDGRCKVCGQSAGA
jgi:hypothetical protein